MSNKLESFVVFPRSIHDNLLEGKITPTEFFVLCFLRSGADPYSRIHTSLEDIKNTLGINCNINGVNKILISLKKKGYIFYEKRMGKRGMFIINMDEWILPNKTIARIKNKVSAEQEQSFGTKKKMLDDVKSKMASNFSGRYVNESGVVNNTDIDTDTDNELSIDKHTPYTGIDKFNPRNSDEGRCLQIAQELGESDINFILSLLLKHGIDFIERAYQRVLADIRDGKPIENKRAYFNSTASKEAEKHVKD